MDWVDELDPAVSIGYDSVNQRLSFQVDRTVLGSGTSADFTSFTAYGSADQTGTNGLGLRNADNAPEVPIRGGEVLHGDSFVATGEEIQPNDKRYGISVQYNSDLQNFTIASGTTGEAIAGNGAIGVSEEQKASNIQIGRYALNENGVKTEQPYDVDAVIIGNGDNSLFGVGATKNDFLFSAGTGLKATSAEAVGATANEPLSNVFKLSSQTGDNVFNVSVNGINGIIEVPATSYVGTTLADALETRINQIVDPTTGKQLVVFASLTTVKRITLNSPLVQLGQILPSRLKDLRGLALLMFPLVLVLFQKSIIWSRPLMPTAQPCMSMQMVRW